LKEKKGYTIKQPKRREKTIILLGKSSFLTFHGKKGG